MGEGCGDQAEHHARSHAAFAQGVGSTARALPKCGGLANFASQAFLHLLGYADARGPQAQNNNKTIITFQIQIDIRFCTG